MNEQDAWEEYDFGIGTTITPEEALEQDAWEEYDFGIGTTMTPEEALEHENAWKFFLFARNVLKRPWPKAEPTIAKSAAASLEYSRQVLKERFPAGEPAIAKSAAASSEYSRYVLKERFPAGEPAIAREANRGGISAQAAAYMYCKRYDLTPAQLENGNE